MFIALLGLELQAPSEWDAGASMALMLVFAGFFMAEQAWRALAADLGHIKTQAFGYMVPLGALFGGVGVMIAAGYWFLRWAAI